MDDYTREELVDIIIAMSSYLDELWGNPDKEDWLGFGFHEDDVNSWYDWED